MFLLPFGLVIVVKLKINCLELEFAWLAGAKMEP